MEEMVERNLFQGKLIKILQGDLTEAKVDAVVNAANEHLAHGGGVAGAIVRRGGEVIQKESDDWVRAHGLVTPEKPAITTAGRLPCDFVIHTVGPKWGEGDEDQKLHKAVYHALNLAAERDIKQLALPAISTGIFGFPKQRAARVILGAIEDFFQECPAASLEEVLIVLFDSPPVKVFLEDFSERWPEDAKGR